MRLTKLLRGLDGFADDKWVRSGGETGGLTGWRVGGRLKNG